MSMREILYDWIGSLLLGISIVVFAVNAQFAPGGVTGLAVISNYLTGIPIGLATVLINIPIIVLTFRLLGLRFFIMSAKTILFGAIFVDYICPFLPVFEGARWLAAILSGVFAGVGYSLIFNEDSCTGGTDFIMAAIRRKHPKLSFGLLAFFLDGSVIVLSIWVYDRWTFVYGMIYTLVTSVALDLTTKVLENTIQKGMTKS